MTVSEPVPVYDPARCLSCEQPATNWTKTGHGLCDTHQEIFQSLYDQEPEGPTPVNLRELMSGEPAGEEWLTEPLLPAGKLVAIVSKRGDGKSLLMLDIACAAATGQATLHQPEGEPRHVVYLDMEMGPDDLYDRLSDLSYTVEHPLFGNLVEHLHYYQLPSLPPLDTEGGGEALESLVDLHKAELVVIDTISRVVTGDENAAEPYRDLYRNTEIRLKRRRVTLARLDHLGKDPGKGSRGSSAKEDPMDVVWQMTLSATGQLVLTLTKGRQGWIPRSVTVTRLELINGNIKHVIHDEPEPDWLRPLVATMDKLKIDPNMGSARALQVLKAEGHGTHKAKVIQAQRRRRNFVKPFTTGSGTRKTTQAEPGAGTGAEPEQETLINLDELQNQTPEPPLNRPVPLEVPSRGRNQAEGHPELPESSTFDDIPEDYEPDPEDLPDPWPT